MSHPRWQRLLLMLLLLTPLPAIAEDFWTSLAADMRLTEIEHPRIDAWESRLRARGAEWAVNLRLGRDVLWPIATAVRARNMPAELVLVPAIESRFRAQAESHVGAAGIWQLVPATADQLGLQRNWWCDERADIMLSTQAALEYLAYLYRRFGSWPLALAAYNAGEGRISRAIRSNREHNRGVDYWSLELPSQAEDYVPKLIALARLIRNHRSLRLPFVENGPSFAAVDTRGPLDLEQAARLSGTPLARLYELNPQLRRWTVSPEGPYKLYLPRENVAAFNKALTGLAPTERIRWRRHTIKRGDTLNELASKNRSSAAMIRQANELNGDVLPIGKTLLIPMDARALSRPVLSAARRASRLAYRAQQPENGIHIVRGGDTLWSIARNNSMSVDQLASLNGLNRNNRLVPGQRLLLAEIDDVNSVVYVVRQGDVLSRIAEQFRVTVLDIRRWNDLSRDLLHPGQQLQLNPGAPNS